MRKQFADKNGNIVYCDDNLLRVTVPKKFFRKEVINEIGVTKIKKCTIDTNLNMIFYLENDIIWQEVKLEDRNLTIAEKIRTFINIDVLQEKQIKEEVKQIKKDVYSDKYTFEVAGAQYYEDEAKRVYAYMRKIEELPYGGLSNSEIKEDDLCFVYEINQNYTKINARLEKEPENEYDKNAIKIIAITDKKEYLVGYVPKRINKYFLDNWSIIKNTCLYAKGGKYKMADCDYNDNLKKINVRVVIEEDEYNFNLEIEFTEKINISNI